MSGYRDGSGLVAACLVLIVGIWVNTGTLAPLGATLDKPFVSEPCRYLLNIDHFHYKASFLMLDGAPREQWAFSVALRRILYFLVAYPFMKLLGFGGGGLVTNAVISVAALAVFWRALQRRLGGRVSIIVLWTLATYPGWFYWAGLPYSYAAIVPASLLCLVVLWRVETLTTWRQALAVGLGLGVLFTAYDLLPFFGVPAVVLLLWRRRWIACAVLALAEVAPMIVVSVALDRWLAVPFRNVNTEAYYRILASFLPPYDGAGWRSLLAILPAVFVDTYLFSNFLFVPLAFLLALLAARRLPRDRGLLGPAELTVLAASTALFFFNNAGPPYPGWQLRGFWIARLYQPVLPAMIAAVAALSASAVRLPRPWRLGWRGALVVILAAHAWVVFAPALGQAELSGLLYYRFYRHAPRAVYADNLRRYGIRPVGFCAARGTASADGGGGVGRPVYTPPVYTPLVRRIRTWS